MKPHPVEISNMLKIEGKGSQQVGQRYDKEYELARKQADRDIRAELRKIYNLKPSPKKHSRRIVELPRLNWIIFDEGNLIITPIFIIKNICAREVEPYIPNPKNNSFKYNIPHTASLTFPRKDRLLLRLSHPFRSQQTIEKLKTWS